MKPTVKQLCARVGGVKAAAGLAGCAPSTLYRAIWAEEAAHAPHDFPARCRERFFAAAAAAGIDLFPAEAGDLFVIHDTGGDRIALVLFRPDPADRLANAPEVGRSWLSPDHAIAEGLRLARAGLDAKQRLERTIRGAADAGLNGTVA